MKRVFIRIIRSVAGIAAVVFFFCPVSTWTAILVLCSSIAVILICQIVLGSLDETLMDHDGPSGYWPPKPVDWAAPSEDSDAEVKGLPGKSY